MSSAGDLTVLRQIIAQYSVAAANQNAWSTTYPIQTSANIAATSINLSSSSVGLVTLVGGTATVSTSACATSSYVFLTVKTVGGSQGLLRVTPGAGSFVITSASGSDTSVVQWLVVNPA
jgi:hypothetical protein